MVSRLEHALSRSHVDKDPIRSTLFSHLSDGSSLYVLRLVSRRLKTSVDDRPVSLFRKLYMDLPFPTPQPLRNEKTAPNPGLAEKTAAEATNYTIPHNLPSLWTLAPNCTSLTIRVMYGEQRSPYENGDALAQVQMAKEAVEKRRASMNPVQRRMWNLRHRPYEEPEQPMAVDISEQETMSADEWNLDLYTWEDIFRAMKNLVQLTISTNCDPGWPGCTKSERLLNMLRIALERGQPPKLRTVCLYPVHAAGIVHLRWIGFAAFVERPFRAQHDNAGLPRPRHNAEIWTNLTTLDLRIRNPAATKTLVASQIRMSLKVLEDYLRSFSRHLRCLRFVWLDAAGPHPLALDEQEGLEDRRSITWPRLAELWLGNVTDAEYTLELLPYLAPNVTTVKIMRDAYCSVRNVPNSPKVWRDFYDESVASRGHSHPALTASTIGSDGIQFSASSNGCARHRAASSLATDRDSTFTRASAVPAPLAVMRIAKARHPYSARHPTPAVKNFESDWTASRSARYGRNRGREPPPVSPAISPTAAFHHGNEHEHSRENYLAPASDAPRPTSSIYTQNDRPADAQNRVSTVSSIESRPMSKFMDILRKTGRPPKRKG